MKPAIFCEVSFPPYTEDQEMQRISIPEARSMSIKQLHEGIRQAKNKAEAGSVMRRFISCSGGWSDLPKDVWDKLEEMFPNKK